MRMDVSRQHLSKALTFFLMDCCNDRTTARLRIHQISFRSFSASSSDSFCPPVKAATKFPMELS